MKPTYAQTLKRGCSLSFVGSFDAEALAHLARVGVETVELSFPYAIYFDELDFPHRAATYAQRAAEAGLSLWSIHLPFSSRLDISALDAESRAATVECHKTLIRAAGDIGIRVAVLHPSSEPISDDIRQARLENSRENILRLREACDAAGMRLAVENLPRTCLCNRSDEMISLLRGTGAGLVFDTNHALGEDNLHFLSALIDSGLPLHSLHISDYDFVDERHRLPGDGVNRWGQILARLEAADYRGPLMYEVSRHPRDREEISFEALGGNMTRLAAGDI